MCASLSKLPSISWIKIVLDIVQKWLEHLVNDIRSGWDVLEATEFKHKAIKIDLKVYEVDLETIFCLAEVCQYVDKEVEVETEVIEVDQVATDDNQKALFGILRNLVFVNMFMTKMT